MAPYHIRPYEDSDFEAVHAIFTQGMMEHTLASSIHGLKRPQTQLLFLGLFLGVLAASGSILLSLVALAVALAGSWFYIRSLWASYVWKVLCSDLQDIRKTYLEAADSCFWVAESNGAVVGMVAAVSLEGPSEMGSMLELKRMSVAREHRGQGIAKALSRKVICFAREHGYSAVVLATSIVNHTAQHLYEALGFQKVRERSLSALARFLQFSFLYYRYDIQGLAEGGVAFV